MSAFIVFTVSPELLWWACLPPLGLGAMHLCLCKLLWPMWRRREGLNRKISESGSELLRKIRTIREFGMEVSESDVRQARDQYTCDMNLNIRATEMSVWHLHGFLWACQRCLLLKAGAQLMGAGSLNIGSLLAIENQLGSIAHYFRTFIDKTPEIARALVPAGKIAEMLATKSQIEGDAFEERRIAPRSTTTSRLCPSKFEGKILFKDVHFSYPKDPRKKILRGLSFGNDPLGKIRSIAFVGETGCGKSTSLSILKRFYNPTSGTVLLDGKPIDAYDPRHLRRHMAIVAQKTTLLKRSIRENIVYGMRPRPSEDEIVACCKMASIWDDICAMPDKLDSICDNCLSGGQEQRIAIARALIRKPTILLLDEATSALDAVNERVVQRAIDKMMDDHGGTSITVAHRLTTVRNCDMIYVMHKGMIVEEGKHADLLQKKVETVQGKIVRGYYRNLWEIQQGGKERDSHESPALAK
jgi:ABC-type multidrug transport system fused ATPase/permease subunit